MAQAGMKIEDYGFECERCHTFGLPEDFAYIGSAEEGDTQCSPFMEMKQICFNCATPEEMQRWYGGNAA